MFFSDNGSTGIEVALKMGLNTYIKSNGSFISKKHDLGVLGLQNSYHGDTIGAMSASPPSSFNEQVPWYRPRGVWLETPNIGIFRGKYSINVPSAIADVLGLENSFTEDELFSHDRKDTNLYTSYRNYVEKIIVDSKINGIVIASFIAEPLLLGAGGMIFVDPLFYLACIDQVR